MESNEAFIFEPVRWTNITHWASERYVEWDQAIRASQWSVPIAIATFLLLATLVYPRTRRLSIQWVTSVGSYVSLLRGNWTMRRERYKEQVCSVRGAIISHIEDSVDARAMTRREANDMYRLFLYRFPDFKRCIERVDGKGEIKAELASADRDAMGKIIPLPLDGGASPVKAAA